MRLLLLVAALTGLTACSTGTTTEAPAAPASATLADDVVHDCYTVVLFDPIEVKAPHEDVPPEHAAFLGEWRFGAWNGKWCHDIIVTEVLPGGTVHLMDMHAPYEAWGKRATAFPRKGRITEDGVLVFRHGVTQRSYRVEDDHLVARRESADRDYEAVLTRPEIQAAEVIDNRDATSIAKLATR